MRSERIGSDIADALGEPRGVRIFHTSDAHNRVRGVRAAARLARAAHADLTIDTGDVSGVGGLWEWLFIQAFVEVALPYVFAPGNHDGDLTRTMMAAKGARVLDGKAVQVGGLTVWGFPDPNRTRFGRGDAYSVALAREAATTRLPDVSPVVAAVHSEHMVRPDARIPLVICGHDHSPMCKRQGDTWVLRPGSSGGGGPFGGDLRFGVADVEPGTCMLTAAWFITVGQGVSVDRVV